MKTKKQNRTKIGVGSVVKAKVGELEKITREGRSRRMRKKVVRCVQDLAGKKNFLVQFEYWQKKEISSSSLAKEKVEMDGPLSHSPEKEQGELLTIVGYPEVGEPCVFVNGLFVSIFYCLCYEMDVSTYMS